MTLPRNLIEAYVLTRCGFEAESLAFSDILERTVFLSKGSVKICSQRAINDWPLGLRLF